MDGEMKEIVLETWDRKEHFYYLKKFSSFLQHLLQYRDNGTARIYKNQRFFSDELYYFSQHEISVTD